MNGGVGVEGFVENGLAVRVPPFSCHTRAVISCHTLGCLEICVAVSNVRVGSLVIVVEGGNAFLVITGSTWTSVDWACQYTSPRRLPATPP